MRVLMFGWEFPPFKTGGLGTACYGLTRGLNRMGAEIIFVVPRSVGIETSEYVKIIGSADVRTRPVGTGNYNHTDSGEVAGYAELYGKNLFEEMEEYKSRAMLIAQREKFDIIHAHDWITIHAGLEARKVSGKPLVIHVHSTEYDRTGGWGVDPVVRDIEQAGAREADHVITVSNRTKLTIMEKYGISAEKISVVYNAVDVGESVSIEPEKRYPRRIVLFLGRLTLQKGPEYFLEAASKVLEEETDVMFVMTGSGDMMYRMIEYACDLNIGHKVLFTGFLSGTDLDRIYDMADVYVMPSVSEPFGIVPLEAMSHGIPVIISRQSGVSEVIKNALKVDFWDVDKIASSIIAVLRYKALRDLMARNGKSEIESFNWDDSAMQCINVYNKVL